MSKRMFVDMVRANAGLVFTSVVLCTEHHMRSGITGGLVGVVAGLLVGAVAVSEASAAPIGGMRVLESRMHPPAASKQLDVTHVHDRYRSYRRVWKFRGNRSYGYRFYRYRWHRDWRHRHDDRPRYYRRRLIIRR